MQVIGDGFKLCREGDFKVINMPIKYKGVENALEQIESQHTVLSFTVLFSEKPPCFIACLSFSPSPSSLTPYLFFMWCILKTDLF